MKKTLIYLIEIYLVLIFITGCTTEGYFVDRNINVFKNITLKTDMLFEFNSSYMKKKNFNILDELVSEIKQNKPNITKIEVIGHSDLLGEEKYNIWLSQRRAQRVADYLISQGISCDVNVLGIGSSKPIVKCDQSDHTSLVACLEPNRRVEINFINNPKTIR